MPWCNDPFLNYLKSFGYNTVLLPRADVRPLQVWTLQGNALNYYGELKTVLVEGDSIPRPPITKNSDAANVSGQRTSDLSIGVGLSLLGSILGAMGGLSIGLNEKYQQARTLALELHDVQGDRIEPAKLDQFLTDADVSPFSPDGILDAFDANEMFVTTATVKSRKFTIEAKKAGGVALELPIPEIEAIVGGNVKVSYQSSMTSRLTYEGQTPLVFGFQAVQLFYDRGQYTRHEPLPPNIGLRGLEDVPRGTKLLTTEAPFLRLHK